MKNIENRKKVLEYCLHSLYAFPRGANNGAIFFTIEKQH